MADLKFDLVTRFAILRNLLFYLITISKEGTRNR